MKMKIPRPLKWSLAIAGLLLGTVYGAIFWIESEPGQRWIEHRASKATQRDVSIGDINVLIGWRPGFRVSALRISNPEWAKSEQLIDTDLIETRFRLLPLLKAHVIVEDLTLVQAKIGLEREENRNTWTFDREQKKEDSKALPFELRRVNIDRGRIAFRDTTTKTDLIIDVAGDVGGGRGLALAAHGIVRGEKATGVARLPSLLPSKDTPVEMSAAFAVGKLTAAAAGIVRDIDIDGIDLDVDVSGASLADFKKLAPVNLPNTPPYRLTGHVRNPKGAVIVDGFSGRVGDSDLSGEVSYDRNGKRPLLKANLVSHLLDLDDLGPLVGAPPKTGPGETASGEQKQQAQVVKDTQRVLPQKRFAVEDWPIMDADVNFQGKKIVDAARVPIEDLSAKWIMDAGVLRFEPLRFRMAHGEVVANIQIDSNSKPPAGKAKIQVSGLNLRELFPPKSGTMTQPLGDLYGRIDITGRGSSTADLFATSNGRIAMLVNGGYISNLLMEAAGLDVAEALRILATKDVQVRLRCAVADLSIKDGTATPQVLVIDTTDTIVTAKGSVDLKSELLDIETDPVPKDPSIFVLRSPVYIRGHFIKPTVRPKMGPIAARVAGGALLGIVNPLLAVLPFIETGPGQDSDCGQLMARVKSDGVTEKPPPRAHQAQGPAPKGN